MPSTRSQFLSFATAAALPRIPRRRSSRAISSPSKFRPITSSTSVSPSPSPAPLPLWHQTKSPDRCFRLTLTLACGQAFRWHDCGTAPFPLAYGGLAREWAGVVGARLLVLRQAEQEPPDGADDPVWWRVASGAESGAADVVHDYFRLGHDQTEIVAKFCDADARYNTVFPVYRGCRVVRQEPVETLFGFICSSNNNVKRISSMVLTMARRYGTSIGEYGGREHFVFPSVDVLAKEVSEEALRESGFGYRAKYIVGTAAMLQKDADEAGMSAEDLLYSYRGLGRKEVAKKLVRYPGVGRKVAGCAALFSLDQLGEIPCDTHIWQIATRYMPELKQKSLTDRVYNQVGDFFRGRFGEKYAGLAQTMLFVGELSDFKDLAPTAVPVKKSRKRESVSVKVEEKKEELLVDPGTSGVNGKVKEENVIIESPGKRRGAKGPAKKSPSKRSPKRKRAAIKVEDKEEDILASVSTYEDLDETNVKEEDVFPESPTKHRRTKSIGNRKQPKTMPS